MKKPKKKIETKIHGSISRCSSARWHNLRMCDKKEQPSDTCNCSLEMAVPRECMHFVIACTWLMKKIFPRNKWLHYHSPFPPLHALQTSRIAVGTSNKWISSFFLGGFRTRGKAVCFSCTRRTAKLPPSTAHIHQIEQEKLRLRRIGEGYGRNRKF